MEWDNNDISNLTLIGKDVGIHLAESICRKLDLGKPIEQDIDYLYLISNIVFATEHSSALVYTDEYYSYLNEMVNRIEIQRNRYRGL